MEIYKKFIAKENKILVAIIPIIGGVLGIIFGIICFYAIPSIIPATNVLTAVLIGGASGLSATGCNQIFKQLKKYGIEVKEPEDKTTNEETKDE